MMGYGDGTFRPNNFTIRAMITVMLWRLNGGPAMNYVLDFENVREGAGILRLSVGPRGRAWLKAMETASLAPMSHDPRTDGNHCRNIAGLVNDCLLRHNCIDISGSRQAMGLHTVDPPQMVPPENGLPNRCDIQHGNSQQHRGCLQLMPGFSARCAKLMEQMLMA